MDESESGGTADADGLMGEGVLKLQFGSMEHQAGSGTAVAIESVAEDRGMEAIDMGHMNAQLMGATCLGEKGYKKRAAVALFEDAISGDGRFSVGVIYSLPRPVEGVTHEREGDASFRCRRSAERSDEGFVALGDLAREEELLHTSIGLCGLSDEHDAAGVHIQPMHGEVVGMLEPIDETIFTSCTRNGEQSCGFVDGQEIRVGVEHNGLRCKRLVTLLDGVRVEVYPLEHMAEDRSAFTHTGRIVLLCST